MIYATMQHSSFVNIHSEFSISVLASIHANIYSIMLNRSYSFNNQCNEYIKVIFTF